MKLKKFLAVALVMIMFELFFGLGFYIANQPTKQVLIRNVETPVAVFEPCYNNTVYVPLYNLTEKSVAVYGLGVHEDNTTGELIEINISLSPGKGRILIDSTFHAMGEDLQDSMTIIKDYTERYTHTFLDYYDIRLSLNANAHTISGASGSAAMTVGLIAILENKTMIPKAAMTGVLLLNGEISGVDGLDVKIKVAEDMGFTRIVIPKRQCDGYNSTIEVICAANIGEAMQYMTQ